VGRMWDLLFQCRMVKERELVKFSRFKKKIKPHELAIVALDGGCKLVKEMGHVETDMELNTTINYLECLQ
jgi:hypothetical protein